MTVKEILSSEAKLREQANDAFALAIIVEGLKPVPESEEALDRATSVESVAARVWLAAAQGDMKAILLIRDTLDGLPVQEVTGKLTVTHDVEALLRGRERVRQLREQSCGDMIVESEEKLIE